MRIATICLTLLMFVLLPITATAAEDPRMADPADLMATICTNEVCVDRIIRRARTEEVHGTIEKPHIVKRTMSLAACNRMVRFRKIQIMARISGAYGSKLTEVRKLYCKRINEQSI